MPFKRPNSPYYRVRRLNLPGYGPSGQLTTRTTNKALARRMEQALEDLAELALVEPAYTELLDAVCKTKQVDLPTLLKAKNAGTLDDLLRTLSDPLLTVAIAEYRANNATTRAMEVGLGQLEQYMPAGARLSYLRKGKHITDLCHDAERDTGADGKRLRKRNSVRRYLLRSVSMLLRYHLGNAERDRVFADVRFAAEDDTRKVHLTTAQMSTLIRTAVELGYSELSIIIRMALVTAADRGELVAGPAHNGKTARGLLKDDIRIYETEDGELEGVVTLRGTKTATRVRTMALTPALCDDLLTLAGHKNASDPVFDMPYRDLDYPWKQVRSAAGLSHVRFKDLRAQASQYGEEAGIPLTVLQRAMGHANASMTRRYQEREVIMTSQYAQKIERAMGLTG